jgi:hypothetical protein
MGLIERLEKRARELDWRVRSVTKGYYGEPACDYDQQAADDRELLLAAVDEMRRSQPIERYFWHMLIQWGEWVR